MAGYPVRNELFRYPEKVVWILQLQYPAILSEDTLGHCLGGRAIVVWKGLSQDIVRPLLHVTVHVTRDVSGPMRNAIS